MRWLFASNSKVIRRRDQALSEMSLPDSVHDDSGDERVICSRQPTSQFKTPGAVGNSGSVRPIDNLQKSSRGDWPLMRRFASALHIGVARLPFADSETPFQRGGLFASRSFSFFSHPRPCSINSRNRPECLPSNSSRCLVRSFAAAPAVVAFCQSRFTFLNSSSVGFSHGPEVIVDLIFVASDRLPELFDQLLRVGGDGRRSQG